jgi:hypothetical protein
MKLAEILETGLGGGGAVPGPLATAAWGATDLSTTCFLPMPSFEIKSSEVLFGIHVDGLL